tara:strand:- start:368 stop:511 length:144 start_codon:yes stop_codon:yes gene_type:complete
LSRNWQTNNNIATGNERKSETIIKLQNILKLKIIVVLRERGGPTKSL